MRSVFRKFPLKKYKINYNIYSSLMTSVNQADRSLNMNNINPNVIKLQYAVRGPIVIRSAELKNMLKEGKDLPFKEIINANIGDCHATGQKYITFLRQITAGVVYPELLEGNILPEDVKSRVKRILDGCAGGSIGSYSDSTGIRIIREDVADFIKQRDGIPSNPDDIFLSTGASASIKAVLFLMSSGGKQGKGKSGIMVSIPQYPLYSATNSEYDAHQISYYLDEANGWGLNESELERALDENKSMCSPRAIVVINPGNPTGQVLNRSDIETVIKFAYKHKLVVLADEVYQQNVYVENKSFVSFKKVLHDLGEPINKAVELASFFSVSKGYMGECGFRGGYCELVNFNSDVKAQLYKSLSASLCSSTIGQAMMDAVVNPPKSHEPSFKKFDAERNQVLGDLKYKAKLVSETFNSIPGYSCNQLEGAMYAFPKIELPAKAVRMAQSKDMAPDFYYCMRLLESTGICIVPGSGFGQREGTYHFRTTILPPVEQIKILIEKIRQFHINFIEEFK